MNRDERDACAKVCEAAVKDAERYRHAMREAMYLLDQPEPRPHAAFSELLLALNPAIDNRKKSAIDAARGCEMNREEIAKELGWAYINVESDLLDRIVRVVRLAEDAERQAIIQAMRQEIEKIEKRYRDTISNAGMKYE